MTATDTSAEDTARWQKCLASKANNRAWALAEQPSRTSDDDEEMLQAAHASAHLWKSIGSVRNDALASMLLAHVYALLKLPNPARHYLARSTAFYVSEPPEPWEAAFLHVIGANVAHATGDAISHRARYVLADTAIRDLANPEDRRILQSSFDVIAKPTGT
jgi:hypothetical protein